MSYAIGFDMGYATGIKDMSEVLEELKDLQKENKELMAALDSVTSLMGMKQRSLEFIDKTLDAYYRDCESNTKGRNNWEGCLNDIACITNTALGKNIDHE